VYFILEKDKI